jgi:hypothetical protein
MYSTMFCMMSPYILGVDSTTGARVTAKEFV